MTIRDALEQYATSLKLVHLLEEEIEDIRLRSPAMTGEPIGNREPGNPTERKALKTVELIAMLEKEKAELTSLRLEVEHLMQTVEDPEVKAIIRLHYFQRKTWRQTCIIMYGYADPQYPRKRVTRYLKKNQED